MEAVEQGEGGPEKGFYKDIYQIASILVNCCQHVAICQLLSSFENWSTSQNISIGKDNHVIIVARKSMNCCFTSQDTEKK